MKKVLLVIHELSYSGAPFSTKRMCQALLKNHYWVEVWSYQKGPFENEFNKIGINVKIVNKNNLDNKTVRKEIKKFDLAITNTILTYQFADLAKNLIPTIWYIREAHNLPWQFFSSDIGRYYALLRAENIYSVSEYARDFIVKNYNSNVRVVHNCVDDEYAECHNKEGHKDRGHKDINRVKFLALGTIEKRKNFDVFIHAYTSMSEENQEKCELHFAGRLMEYAISYYQPLLEEIEKHKNIYYHGEIQDRNIILELIDTSDVVVVVSEDESCSLVVLEAAMMSKAIIISENIGARYIISDKNGWIVKTGEVEALREVYESILNLDPARLIEMGQESRRMYLRSSTFEIYEKEIVKMVKDNFVFSKLLYQVKHLYKRVYEAKQREMEKNQKEKRTKYHFPNYSLRNGSKIVIYGAGDVGKALIKHIAALNLYDVVLWADQRYETLNTEQAAISSPESINRTQYDYVIIAVLEQRVADAIKLKLQEIGIPKERILWEAPTLLMG